jgi:hypothetical protein
MLRYTHAWRKVLITYILDIRSWAVKTFTRTRKNFTSTFYRIHMSDIRSSTVTLTHMYTKGLHMEFHGIHTRHPVLGGISHVENLGVVVVGLVQVLGHAAELVVHLLAHVVGPLQPCTILFSERGPALQQQHCFVSYALFIFYKGVVVRGSNLS